MNKNHLIRNIMYKVSIIKNNFQTILFEEELTKKTRENEIK